MATRPKRRHPLDGGSTRFRKTASRKHIKFLQFVVDERPSKGQPVIQLDQVTTIINGEAVSVVPTSEPPPTKRIIPLGSAKGIITYIADDFDAPLDEFAETM